MDYKTFLKKHWPGNPVSTAERAAAWRRLHPQASAPAEATPTPQPGFTPGAMDAQGVAQTADLDYNYQIRQRALEQQYADAMAQINAERPRVDQRRDEGYQSADRNTAGRGMYRSGVRNQYRTDIGADADRAHQDLTLAAQRAANARQQGQDINLGEFRTNKTNIGISSNERQREAWQEDNPMTVASPAPVARTAAKTYASFLAGRPSSKTLARQWDKKFNYGQRFG